jgi:hypothetical protein
VGTAIGIIVSAVVTVLASRYYFQRSTNKSLGVYELLNSLVFSGIAPDVRKQLKFLFKDKEVNDLQQLVLLVANDGERAIRDVIEPLELAIPPQVQLLDASIVHMHPKNLKLNATREHYTDKSTNLKIDFPLLNKREFFIVKLLLSGHVDAQKLVFRLLADDLPRTIQIKRLLPSDYRETSYKFKWNRAAVSLAVLIILAWVLYSATLLQHAYPMLFPYPWTSFVVSAKSLFLVITGVAVVLLFAALGFMALGATVFGEFPPPKRPRFPLPKELAVFPYGVFLLAPKPADKRGQEPPDAGAKPKP